MGLATSTPRQRRPFGAGVLVLGHLLPLRRLPLERTQALAPRRRLPRGDRELGVVERERLEQVCGPGGGNLLDSTAALTPGLSAWTESSFNSPGLAQARRPAARREASDRSPLGSYRLGSTSVRPTSFSPRLRPSSPLAPSRTTPRSRLGSAPGGVGRAKRGDSVPALRLRRRSRGRPGRGGQRAADRGGAGAVREGPPPPDDSFSPASWRRPTTRTDSVLRLGHLTALRAHSHDSSLAARRLGPQRAVKAPPPARPSRLARRCGARGGDQRGLARGDSRPLERFARGGERRSSRWPPRDKRRPGFEGGLLHERYLSKREPSRSSRRGRRRRGLRSPPGTGFFISSRARASPSRPR